MTPQLQGRIAALKAKAALRQSLVDSCDRHLWLADYVSPIGAAGSSARCVRCGERRGWKDIGPEEQWQLDTH